jgi:hypothetical protein
MHKNFSRHTKVASWLLAMAVITATMISPASGLRSEIFSSDPSLEARSYTLHFRVKDANVWNSICIAKSWDLPTAFIQPTMRAINWSLHLDLHPQNTWRRMDALVEKHLRSESSILMEWAIFALEGPNRHDELMATGQVDLSIFKEHFDKEQPTDYDYIHVVCTNGLGKGFPNGESDHDKGQNQK